MFEVFIPGIIVHQCWLDLVYFWKPPLCGSWHFFPTLSIKGKNPEQYNLMLTSVFLNTSLQFGHSSESHVYTMLCSILLCCHLIFFFFFCQHYISCKLSFYRIWMQVFYKFCRCCSGETPSCTCTSPQAHPRGDNVWSPCSGETAARQLNWEHCTTTVPKLCYWYRSGLITLQISLENKKGAVLEILVQVLLWSLAGDVFR